MRPIDFGFQGKYGCKAETTFWLSNISSIWSIGKGYDCETDRLSVCPLFYVGLLKNRADRMQRCWTTIPQSSLSTFLCGTCPFLFVLRNSRYDKTLTTRCSAPRALICTGLARADPSGSSGRPSFSEQSCQNNRGAGNRQKPYRLPRRIARLLAVRFR